MPDSCVSGTAPATRNASLILFKCPTPATLFETATKPSCFAHFWPGAESLAPATRKHILTSKSGPRMVCFVHFDFEIHNGVHFLNISTSKRAPTLRRFAHFDFEMCFAPQRRAFFQQLNFQSGLRPSSFYPFDFQMCFAPQRRALFHLLNFQKWSGHVMFLAF